jgi:hypothetical protein
MGFAQRPLAANGARALAGNAAVPGGQHPAWCARESERAGTRVGSRLVVHRLRQVFSVRVDEVRNERGRARPLGFLDADLAAGMLAAAARSMPYPSMSVAASSTGACIAGLRTSDAMIDSPLGGGDGNLYRRLACTSCIASSHPFLAPTNAQVSSLASDRSTAW